jgi:hypothetical protein
MTSSDRELLKHPTPYNVSAEGESGAIAWPSFGGCSAVLPDDRIA